MRKLRLISGSLMGMLCLALMLVPSTSFSQTWSPRYTSITSNSGGFYEYLPAGYNDPANAGRKWPVILFVHGVGELGGGSPAELAGYSRVGLPGLISSGGFPTSFTVGGQTHSFIVICPQFKSWPINIDIENCLNYIQANYRVDQARIYMTGLSMGGGVTWDYASGSSTNANRLAAILPICGAAGANTTNCGVMARANLPVLATHNMDDGVVAYQTTVQFVDLINSFGPTPPAIKVIWPNGGHNAWTRTYDPSTILTGSLNAYQWMLQYTRGASAPPPVSSIGVNMTVGSNVNCTGGNNGAATASATGGTAPYTYSWSDGQTSATATNLKAGNYTVTVRDASNNVGYGSVTITEPAPLALTATPGTISTYGGTTSVTLSASGGTAPYTYGGAATSNLAAGSYTYTVTDAKGCTANRTITISQPSPPPVAAVISAKTDVSCNGGTDGTASVSPAGGIAPYTYQWSTIPMQTSATATGLKAGSYSVAVKDAQGFFVIANVTVNEPAPLVLNASAGTITTAGGQTNVTLSASGGTSPYTYTGKTQDLTAGTYTFNVTDAKGCVASKTVTISEPAPVSSLTATVSTTNVGCSGGSNGSATVTVTSGSSPFSYSWSDGQTTAAANNLRAGSYTVTVKDANNNTATYSVTITEPAKLLLTISQGAPISVYGGQTYVTLSATGGTAPYSFSGITSNLNAGSYTYTVTDANGCTDTKTITLTQPPPPTQAPVTPLTASLVSVTNVSCNGNADGAATVEVKGGVTPYSYSWSNGRSGASESSLAAGTYVVTIKDAAGTTITQTVNIGEPEKLVLSVSQPEQILVTGGQTYVTIAATGGTPPYTFTGRTNNLNAGTYTYTVKDARGCTDSRTLTITEPAPAPPPVPPASLTLNLAEVSNVSCNGQANGSASVEAKGGVSPYTFTWSNGKNGSSVTGLAAGAYTVTVKDAAGSVSSLNVNITEPAKLVLSANQLEPILVSGGQTSISLSASGGTAPYVYSGRSTNLNAGTYTFTVTDAKGCTDSRTVVITEPAPVPTTPQPPVPALSAAVAIQGTPLCNGGAEGSATVEAKGGVAPYSYVWSNGMTTPSANGLTAGAYTVYVKDAAGSSVKVDVQITEPAKLQLKVVQPEPISVYGGQTYVTVDAIGGTAPYAFSGKTTNLVAGTYTFNVTDAKGCTAAQTITITQPDAPAPPAPSPTPEGTTALSISVGSKSDVTCFGAADGQASITVSGGKQPYAVKWSHDATAVTTRISGLPAGIYVATVTDADQKTVTTVVEITQPLQLKLEAIVAGSEVTLVATGGVSPYRYTGVTTNLSAGKYLYTVTDANGCTGSAEAVVLPLPPPPPPPAPVPVVEPLEVKATAGTIPCFNGTTSVNLQISGGVRPYVVQGDTADLRAGVHSYTVTDAVGAKATAEVTIAQPQPLLLQATGDVIRKIGGTTDVKLEASGGTAPYSYTGETRSLKAGTYQFNVVDAKGCTAAGSVELKEPALIVSRFDAAAIDTGIALNWVTSYEYQIDHFVVERSVDNVNFKEFRQLRSNWSSVVRFPQYKVTDNAPVSKRNFYRVFAVTSFGERIELASRDVVFENRSKVEVKNMTNLLDITISNPYREPIEMVLVDMYGRTARVLKVSKDAYIWNSKLSMNDLASGMYVLRISSAHVNHAKQVVKIQ